MSVAFPQARVAWCKLMSTVAMCFASVFSRYRVSAKNINPYGYGFQVFRINAKRVSAQVVYGQPVRDWPYKPLIGKPMRANQFAVNPEMTIGAIHLLGSRPEPARIGLVDLGPKPASRVVSPSVGIACGSKPFVMHKAITLGVCFSLATIYCACFHAVII